MTPDMVAALLRAGACTHEDPAAVLGGVLDAVVGVYGRTMAVVHVQEGDRLRFHAAVNVHPFFRLMGMNSIRYSASYCQYVIGPRTPRLIQDARRDPSLRAHPGVRIGLTRYLGVPVIAPDGHCVGSLCLQDNRVREPLGPEDVEFFSCLAMRVSLELERERRLESLRAAARHHERLAAEHARAAEDKRRFIATVTHDLRQPLAALRTCLFLLTDDGPTDERVETLMQMGDRVLVMQRMVDELIAYTEAEAGQIPIRFEEADLFALIPELAAQFGQEAERLGVRLRTRVDPALRPLRADVTRLEHIVRNLVGNAVRFSALREGGGGRVSIACRQDGPSHWLLEVRDNGIGMAPEVLARAFEEFYQAPESRAGGLGLGLSLVRHHCRTLGAEVSVDGRPGRGATFRVRFPIHPDVR